MPEEAVDDSSHLPDDNVAGQHTPQVSDFLLDLKEKNSLIAFQALLDSVDLWNSCIKYYCDVLNPTSSRASAQMMIDLLETPGGAALFFVGSALFGAFAFLGNYADSQDIQNSTIVRIANDYWPYVRDCIKGVKWTYKGMRSAFLVGQLIYAELSIALIVPLGVGLGMLSAVNRFWNRSMVERRKVIQSTNDGIREHIKCINACYMELDDLPSAWELQHIYPGSVLNINGDYFQISANGESAPLGQISNAERQVLKSNQGQEKGGRIDWFHFKTLLDEQNIPEDSVLRQQCLEKKNFLKEIANQKHVSLNEHAQNVNAGLVYLNEWPSDNDLRYVYQGCIVEKDGAYVVIDLTEEGNQKPLNLSDEEKAFLDAQSFGASIQELTEAFEKSDLPKEGVLAIALKNRKTLSERSSRYNDIVGRPQFQKDAFQAKCSAVLSGVLNAPYYFLGILSMVALPYAAFIGAVAACSTFMILNVVAELYQESEYQRRLKVSELKARMSMVKRLMSSELDLINDSLNEIGNPAHDAKENYIQALNNILDVIEQGKELKSLSDFLNTVQGADLKNLSPEQRELIQHLQNRAAYQKEFTATKKLLHDELVLNDKYLVMQGIRNGLYCYGIANGFLMTLAIMSFFGIFAFTPALFWASIGFGFFCLAAGIAYTVMYSNELCELESTNELDVKALEKDEDLVDEEPHVIIDEPLEGGITAEDARRASSVYYVDPVSDECINKTADDIKQTRNLMISDQSEVARQFISGNKKGFKCLQTLSVFLPTLAANSTSGATQLVYLGVGLTYGFFFALKGLRNLVRVDNKDYEKSSLWKILTCCDHTETAPIPEPTASVNSFFPYLRKSSQNLQLPASPIARAAGNGI